MDRTVENQHQVRLEFLAITVDRGDQAGRSGFFFSVENHLEVRGDRDPGVVEGSIADMRATMGEVSSEAERA